MSSQTLVEYRAELMQVSLFLQIFRLVIFLDVVLLFTFEYFAFCLNFLFLGSIFISPDGYMFHSEVSNSPVKVFIEAKNHVESQFRGNKRGISLISYFLATYAQNGSGMKLQKPIDGKSSYYCYENYA